MSIAFQQPNFRTSRGKTPKKLIGSFFRLLWRAPLLAFKVLTLPFRIVRWLRQSMTVASGTLLVVSIASLNIIWDTRGRHFLSLLFHVFLGENSSTLMRPKLDYHLPFRDRFQSVMIWRFLFAAVIESIPGTTVSDFV